MLEKTSLAGVCRRAFPDGIGAVEVFPVCRNEAVGFEVIV